VDFRVLDPAATELLPEAGDHDVERLALKLLHAFPRRGAALGNLTVGAVGEGQVVGLLGGSP